MDLTAASPASPKRRRSVIDVDDEAVARQLEQEEQRAPIWAQKAGAPARIARKLAAEEKRKAEEKKRADAIKRKNAAERAAKEKRKSVDTEERRRRRAWPRS